VHSGSMDVTFSVDRGFLPHLVPLIRSLIRHNGRALRYWILLDEDVGERVRSAMRELTGADEIEFLTYRGSIDDFPDFEHPGVEHVSSAAYLRLFLPDLLPDVSRFVYLDADMLCLGQITELFEQPLNGHVVAAVRDPFTRRLCDIPGGMPGWPDLPRGAAQATYYNNGFLVVDAQKWRSESLTAQVLAYIERYRETPRMPDMDAINYRLYGRILRLGRMWNDIMPWRLDAADESDRPDTRLVHFAGSLKPWHSGFPAGWSLEMYRTFAPHPDELDELRRLVGSTA
jgi:lipopolysaccharide biosynthesis glycosyltransferase